MNTLTRWVVVVGFVVSGASLSEAEASDDQRTTPQEHTLTGELIAMWCLMREGSFGTGLQNQSAQINCIRLGSPVAIKVGDALYLVSTTDRKLKNRLMHFVGHKVTVRGTVTPQRDQSLIAISSVERTKQ